MSARTWLNADRRPAALGVEQRQPEQDQRAGDAGGHTQLAGLRRAGGDAVAAHERLIDAERKSEQVLAEDGKTEHDQGEANQPGERPNRPEGQAKQADGGGDDANGRGRSHALARPAASSVGIVSCHANRITPPIAATTRADRRATSKDICSARGAGSANSRWNFSHSPPHPSSRKTKPEALGAPRQKAATHCERARSPTL